MNPSAPGIRSELGRYRLVALLAQGGASKLFRAREARGGEDVLLEVPVDELRLAPDFADRLRRDAGLAGQLRHPHVAQTTVEVEDGVPFSVSPDPRGVELTPLVEGLGGLSLARSAEIVAQVASALAAAHAADLVHGTLEPSRILVANDDGDDHAIVTGFGFAPPPGSDGGVRRPFGLPAANFCPPEQIRGEPATPASDIYALGCVLYHALAAEAPFAGADDMEVLDAQLNREPAAPSEHVPELPEALDAVVARTLAKNPAHRYASAQELAEDLRAVAGAVAGDPELTVSARKKDTTMRWEQSIAGGAHQWSPSNPVASWPEPGSEDVKAVDAPVADAPVEGASSKHEALGWPQPNQAEPAAKPAPKPAEASRPRPGRKVLTRVLPALAAVGAAVALVLLLTDQDDSGTQSKPAAAQPTPAPTPAPARGSASSLVTWPRRNAYTVVIAVSTGNRAAAATPARRAARLGYRAGVLESGKYPNFPSGRFVGFAGVYDARSSADAAARRLRARGVAAAPYVRRVRGAGR